LFVFVPFPLEKVAGVCSFNYTEDFQSLSSIVGRAAVSRLVNHILIVTPAVPNISSAAMSRPPQQPYDDQYGQHDSYYQDDYAQGQQQHGGQGHYDQGYDQQGGDGYYDEKYILIPISLAVRSV
jgi:hypothetical protein